MGDFSIFSPSQARLCISLYLAFGFLTPAAVHLLFKALCVKEFRYEIDDSEAIELIREVLKDGSLTKSVIKPLLKVKIVKVCLYLKKPQSFYQVLIIPD